MNLATRIFLSLVVAAAAGAGGLPPCSQSFASYGSVRQSARQSRAQKSVGTIKNIARNTIALTTDAGAAENIVIEGSPRLLLIAPGEKDLKNAAPIQLSDLKVGDRILVFGKPSEDAKSIVASTIVAMKSSEIHATQAKEKDEWRRGVGGLVKGADANTGTITISAAAFAGAAQIAVHTTKQTVFRRYAPGSIRFDDAESSTFDRIQTGDQLRARGTREADGNDFAADEIVSGSFRNISGRIISIDAAAGALQVMDTIAKGPAIVKFTAQSELRKLSPALSQRLAMRFARGTAGGTSEHPDSSASSRRSNGTGNGHPRNSAPHAPPDLQQILSRMPSITLSDLKKGDAVAIVTANGAAPGELTAITLLAGVEPILAASPKGSRSITLSPWNLGGGGQADASAP